MPDTPDLPRPDAVEIADDNEAYCDGDVTLDELTPEQLAGLERLPDEMAAVTGLESALDFYDRLAGHDG